MTDAFQLGLDVAGSGDITVVEVPEIEFHRRLEAPFKRDLVDPHAGLAALLQSVTHRGEVVIRRVEMRPVMRADITLLDRGVLALRKLVDADAKVFGNTGRGGVMVEIGDLRQRPRRIACDAGLESDGDIDQLTCHFPLSSIETTPERSGQSPKPIEVTPSCSTSSFLTLDPAASQHPSPTSRCQAPD